MKPSTRLQRLAIITRQQDRLPNCKASRLRCRRSWSLALVPALVVGVSGCATYQAPPAADSSTRQAVTQATQACRPQWTAGSALYAGLTIPLWIPLMEISPAAAQQVFAPPPSPECQRALAAKRKQEESEESQYEKKETHCAQFAQAALAKYSPQKWQQPSCECRKFTAEKPFVFFHPSRSNIVVSAFTSLDNQPMEVWCYDHSSLILVIPPPPNHSCEQSMKWACLN